MVNELNNMSSITLEDIYIILLHQLPKYNILYSKEHCYIIISYRYKHLYMYIRHMSLTYDIRYKMMFDIYESDDGCEYDELELDNSDSSVLLSMVINKVRCILGD